MASKKKEHTPVAEGRSAEDRRSIRRQLTWMAGLVGLAVAVFLIVRWGQDSGWGNPDRAVKARFAKGEAAFVSGRFDVAAVQYEAVVKRYPKHPQVNQALTQLASAYQGLGHLDEALDALRQLVANLEAANDRSDLHAYTLLQIGKLQKDRMDYPAALGALERVRAEHPKTDWSGEALNTIAQVHQSQKRYEEARKAFGQLIKELPGGFLAAEAQAGIGECFEAEGQLKKALQSYQVVLDKYPSAVWETAKARIDALKKEVAGKSKKS
jgi:tetratricopeptide (TPR) repeat protein